MTLQEIKYPIYKKHFAWKPTRVKTTMEKVKNGDVYIKVIWLESYYTTLLSKDNYTLEAILEIE